MADRPGVTTTIEIAAAPSRVLDWLLHAPAFPLWVVGPGRVVQVDDDWPLPGSGFTHETGRGPLRFQDRTIMQDRSPDTGHITLEAMVRPAGLALIQLHVAPAGRGTRLVMHERPIGGAAAALPAPLYQPLLRARNRVAVNRLRRLIENGPIVRNPDDGTTGSADG